MTKERKNGLEEEMIEVIERLLEATKVDPDKQAYLNGVYDSIEMMTDCLVKINNLDVYK